MADGRRRLTILALALGFEGGLFALALLLGWLLGASPLRHIAWSDADAIIGCIATLPPLALYAACVRWPIGPLGRIKAILEEFVRALFAQSSALELAAIALAAGLGEEALFRGVVQGELGRWLGDTAGLLLASALFGLAHCVTPTYALLAGAIGLYLGSLWLSTGNLLAPIVTHALYDFVVLLQLRRAAWRHVSDMPGPAR